MTLLYNIFLKICKNKRIHFYNKNFIFIKLIKVIYFLKCIWWNYEFFIFVYQDQYQYQSKNEKRAFPDYNIYYHRAGRAGRFGRSGLCFTIVFDDKDKRNLKEFCRPINTNIPLKFIEYEKVGDLFNYDDDSKSDVTYDNFACEISPSNDISLSLNNPYKQNIQCSRVANPFQRTTHTTIQELEAKIEQLTRFVEIQNNQIIE